MYQPIPFHTQPLVCLVALDGNGEDREYLCVLSLEEMREVNLKTNTHRQYNGAHAEVLAWKTNNLAEIGFRECSFARFLAAQETYLERIGTGEFAMI